MPFHTNTASINGIEAVFVRAEIDSSPGIHAFSIVGLGDRAVQESQDRVNAAIRNSGFKPPGSQNRKYTVNLAPSDLKKEGTSFDLPIAVAYLLDSKQMASRHDKTLLYAGLSLDGSLAHVPGAISATLCARDAGYSEIIVPSANASEAAYIEGIRVIGAQSLADVAHHLSGERLLDPVSPESKTSPLSDDSFSFIIGQETAKRALIIAAAGSHNVLLNGPPGAGKTLLARSLISILPSLQDQEMLEIAKIYSSIGLLRQSPRALIRPFRNPHHTASPVAVVGGGALPRPGEVSLAHRGVLFLDEIAEFPRNVLEALRQPLEDGFVTISRASGTLTLPAQFLFVASMNPCACGNHGDPLLSCSCSPHHVVRYRKKLSGPLIDRIDLQITVPREPVRVSRETATPLDGIRATIERARAAQAERLRTNGMITNSEITHRDIERVCAVQPSAEKLLKTAINRQHLSLRAYHRSLKLARTIADLEGSSDVMDAHVAEAIGFRVETTPGT